MHMGHVKDMAEQGWANNWHSSAKRWKHAWKPSLDVWRRVIPVKMTEIPLCLGTAKASRASNRSGQGIGRPRPKVRRVHGSRPRRMGTGNARENDRNTPVPLARPRPARGVQGMPRRPETMEARISPGQTAIRGFPDACASLIGHQMTKMPLDQDRPPSAAWHGRTITGCCPRGNDAQDPRGVSCGASQPPPAAVRGNDAQDPRGCPVPSQPTPSRRPLSGAMTHKIPGVSCAEPANPRGFLGDDAWETGAHAESGAKAGPTGACARWHITPGRVRPAVVRGIMSCHSKASQRKHRMEKCLGE